MSEALDNPLVHRVRKSGDHPLWTVYPWHVSSCYNRLLWRHLTHCIHAFSLMSKEAKAQCVSGVVSFGYNWDNLSMHGLPNHCNQLFLLCLGTSLCSGSWQWLLPLVVFQLSGCVHFQQLFQDKHSKDPARYDVQDICSLRGGTACGSSSYLYIYTNILLSFNPPEDRCKALWLCTACVYSLSSVQTK